MTRGPIYRFLEVLTKAFLLGFWDFRAEGLEKVPPAGAMILASTHESHLDPVMVRAALKRPLGYVARSTLFSHRLFGFFIRALGAVPFDRDASGTEGVRGVLDHLGRGHALVLFPEGTRSRDGSLQRLRPGIALIARKSGVPVVPVAVDGTFECWPRQQRMFRPGRVRVVYGEPVRYTRMTGRGEVLSDLSRRLSALKARAESMA